MQEGLKTKRASRGGVRPEKVVAALTGLLAALGQFSVGVSAGQLTDDTATASRGMQLYDENCAACHESGVGEAPLTAALRKLTADHIFRAMNDGIMLAQSGHLLPDERRKIADYLGAINRPEPVGAQSAGVCRDDQGRNSFAGHGEVENWGMGLTNERHAGNSGISPQNVEALELDWVFAFPNSGRARTQPTVAGHTVFTAGQNGKVYALDLNSGCIRWSFQAEAEVRSAISVEINDLGRVQRLYFGDFEGNVYGFDVSSRTLLWKVRADDHPVATITGSLALHKDTIYVPVSSREVVSAASSTYECCTFRGSVVAYDKLTGDVRWQSFMMDEPVARGTNSVGATRFGPSGAPIWSSPTVDEKRGVLYVGTGENYSRPTTPTSDAIVALALEDGAIQWVNQVTPDDAWNGACGRPDAANCPENRGPDYDFGAPPILTTLLNGKQIILAGQKSGRAFAMDPDDGGKLVWRQQVGRGGIMGGIHWGMATDGSTVFVPVSDISVYQRDAHKPARSGLHAISAETGQPIWSTLTKDVCGDAKWRCSPGISAAVTLGNGLVFGGGLDGMLRAFDANTGQILWETNTNRSFEAVNGIEAEGGSLDSDGPVLVGDRLLVTSGYDKWGQKFGNVLLTYRVGRGADEN